MFFMIISAILAVGKENEIGLNGGLPWKSKADLQHFKNLTINHCVLMGLNTYNSIGRPLPSRTNIIISHLNKQIDGCFVFNNVDDGIEFAKKQNEEELFIIGGASIYKYFAENNLLNRVYLTRMLY